jgi:hypothetical protein
MTEPTPYIPPRVWTWNRANGGRFASINRPVAGPTHDKALPVGRHPLQLYSLGTPNWHEPGGSPWMMEETAGVRSSAGRGRSNL